VKQLQEHLPTVTLDRHSPRFNDDAITTRGNLGDPRGFEMESEMMMNEHPYRSRSNVEMEVGKESCERVIGCQR
jgi:hypothetical protein